MSNLKTLKQDVLKANQELPKRNLVLYSWGNVSCIDRSKGVIVIKPAGIPYDRLTVENMSVTDLKGRVLDGPYKPSVDLPIYLVLYKAFNTVSAIVHTHSTYATMWAQAEQAIPCYGTTHADYFYGEVPCTRMLNKDEIDRNYEKATGEAILEEFQKRDPEQIQGVLVAAHGAFTWGSDPWNAVHKSVVLEEIAKMAFGSLLLKPGIAPIHNYLLDRHFLRKHGPDAYFNHDDIGK